MHLCLAMTSAISKVPVVSTEKRKKEGEREREIDKEKEGSVRRRGKIKIAKRAHCWPT